MIIPTTPSSKLLFSTTRVCAQATGKESVGTAFFFHFNIDGKSELPVLITNKHVVAGATTGTFLIHEQARDAEGKAIPAQSSTGIRLAEFSSHWIDHPGSVDLCAMPFEPLRREAQTKGIQPYYLALDESLIPNDETLQQLSALEDVVMVGYPIGLWDSVNNLPVLRRGITATHPAADFCGQPIALADIAAFPGSSGSPVFILNEGFYATQKGTVVGSRVFLLGVLFAGPQFTADGTIQVVDIPTATPVARTSIPSHLGYYVKASEILRLKAHVLSILGISQGGD